MVSRVREKTAKRAAKVREERETYRHVERRDGYRCRACGKPADPRRIGMLDRGHHHHIVFRSAGGGTTRENVCLLCPLCHDDVHHDAERLYLHGNAEHVVTCEQGGTQWDSPAPH